MTKITNSIETINQIFDLMTEKGIKSFKLNDNDLEISIERDCPQVEVMQNMQFTPMASANQVIQDKKKDEIKGNVVNAPIVGTVYTAPSPEDKDFVKVGQRVKKGDVILIIESMKVMNEVKSEFDGVVSVINVKNGEAIEYDQPLMVIE